MDITHRQTLRIVALSCWLLGGCGAHASLHTGVGTGSRQRANSETRSPSTHAAQPAQPAAKATPPRDHDRGHGNDADRVDEDNPGKGHQGTAPLARHDHDRGHGNDADRIDEDNPGKSKKKK